MIRKDMTRGALAFVLLLAFNFAVFVLFWREIPAGNRETLTYMLGQMSGMVTTALAFYFATTKSSADKDVITLTQLDTIGSALNAKAADGPGQQGEDA